MEVYINFKNEKTMEETTMEKKVDVSAMSKEEKAALLAQLQTEAQTDRLARRENYEALRREFIKDVKIRVTNIAVQTSDFKKWLDGEAKAFFEVMKDYGQVTRDGQQSYSISTEDFKLEVKSNKIKKFDERADMAADRLLEYLKGYMERSQNGTDDPMYQMAMTLLERNKAGDLDYKSISKLYELEDKFDGEYGEIMALFKESNVVQSTALNYYFSKRDPDTGVWHRIEPSFCRL